MDTQVLDNVVGSINRGDTIVLLNPASEYNKKITLYKDSPESLPIHSQYDDGWGIIHPKKLQEKVETWLKAGYVVE